MSQDKIKITSDDLISEIKLQDRTIRSTRRCFWYLLLILMFTWASGAAIFITGKFPPIEIKMKQPNFGSVYPDNFFGFKRMIKVP